MAMRIVNSPSSASSSLFILRALLISNPHPPSHLVLQQRIVRTAPFCSNNNTVHRIQPTPAVPQDNRGAKMDRQQAEEIYSKEASDTRAKTKGFSETIMPHILNMYASRATARDFEIYAENATFEDPLMRAEGVKQIKSAFYSLSKVFKESRIVEYTVKEYESSPGKHEIEIDNKQYYKFLGRDIDVVSLIRLYIEDGKVVRHEDWWDKKPPRSRETEKIPMFGRVMETMRRGAMLATHAMMGFGKDPSSSNNNRSM